MNKITKIIMKLKNIFESFFSSPSNKQEIKKESIIKEEVLKSDELQKKLALLVSNISAIDQIDLKNIEYKKMDKSSEKDLFTSFRLDFHTKQELEEFKEKYHYILL